MRFFRLGIFITALLFVSAIAAWAERRVALVIGNSSYEALPELKNPQNDAEDVAAVLSKLGFEVILGTDLDRDRTRAVILQFARALEGADTSLLFYAGHGVQLSDQNHLVPIDAVLSRDLAFDEQTITVDQIVRVMNEFTETSLVFLDACRDNPLTSDIPIGQQDGQLGRGLARIRAAGGSYIAFATAPGNVAYDGRGRNSPFTAALLDHIETPNIDVRLMMSDVRQDVFEATERRQMPWENSSLVGRFYFNNSSQLERLDSANRTEAEAWQVISNSNRKEDYAAFLRDFPDGAFASLANLKFRSLEEFDQRTDDERAGFLLARAANTEGAWNDFLDSYSDGLFAEIAREELSELRDEIDRQKLSLEEIHWRSIRNSRAPADFSTYLLLYPSGAFSDLASQRLEAAQAARDITTALTGREEANEIELEREVKRRAGQMPVQFLQHGLNCSGSDVI